MGARRGAGLLAAETSVVNLDGFIFVGGLRVRGRGVRRAIVLFFAVNVLHHEDFLFFRG